MWQFTSSGRLDGYGGNLDLNIFYGDETARDKYAGVSSNVTEQSEPTPAPQSTLKHHIGEYVEFGSCYASSTAKVGWRLMEEPWFRILKKERSQLFTREPITPI